jgi:hypothetical protein
VLVPRPKEQVKLVDLLDLFTSRPFEEKQRFEGSLQWYLSLNRFVFHSASLVTTPDCDLIEVSVGTPTGQTKTVQVRIPSREVAFTPESADLVASAILKSVD